MSWISDLVPSGWSVWISHKSTAETPFEAYNSEIPTPVPLQKAWPIRVNPTSMVMFDTASGTIQVIARVPGILSVLLGPNAICRIGPTWTDGTPAPHHYQFN